MHLSQQILEKHFFYIIFLVSFFKAFSACTKARVEIHSTNTIHNWYSSLVNGSRYVTHAVDERVTWWT
jgi:hypothetical protein